MSEIRDYQVDHLLLLIGSNPVPNVVAGKLLTKHNGTITLIHSKGDGFKLAERLQVWFCKNYPGVYVGLEEIKESDAGSVFTEVQKVLDGYERELLKQREANAAIANEVGTVRVGLNYTGGTKVMSVHAYLALKSWIENTNRKAIFNKEPVFSYLDARTLEMCFEQVGMHSTIPLPTKQAVNLSIAELLELHDWEPIKLPMEEPVLPESAEALLAVYIDNEQNEIWNEWIHHTLPHHENPREIPWPALPKLREALQKELGQRNGSFLDAKAAMGSGCKDEGTFRKWANGTWLESAVLSVLQACAQELQFEYCMDIQPRVRKSDETKPFFQLDVAATYGYQLFAFSCTTDKSGKGELKQKLFEADVRARQIGGDEARTAVVCRADKKTTDALENEMKRDIILKDRIRVFGRYHLRTDPDNPNHQVAPDDAEGMANNLARHIKKWIIEQSGNRT